MVTNLIYLLGKRFKFVRLLYYKYTKGRALWGVMNFIRDTPTPIEEFNEDVHTESDFDADKFKEQIDKFLKENFTDNE